MRLYPLTMAWLMKKYKSPCTSVFPDPHHLDRFSSYLLRKKRKKESFVSASLNSYFLCPVFLKWAPIPSPLILPSFPSCQTYQANIIPSVAKLIYCKIWYSFLFKCNWRDKYKCVSCPTESFPSMLPGNKVLSLRKKSLMVEISRRTFQTILCKNKIKAF